MTRMVLGALLLLYLMGCSTPSDPADLALKEEGTGPSAFSSSPIEHKVDESRAALLHVALGISYLEKGERLRAKRKFLHAQKLSPDLPEVHMAMAYYLSEVGELKEADAAYRKAISFAPQKGESLNNYGAFLCQQGRYLDAEKHFLRAVKDEDYMNVAEAYENAGLCALKQPNLEQAEIFFKKALSRQPHLSKSLLEMATLNHQRGQTKAAEEYYQRYLAVGQSTPRALSLGIALAEALGKKDRAASYALMLRAEYPDAPETQKMVKTS